MKKLLIMICAMVISGVSMFACGGSQVQTIALKDNGELLTNKNMGWDLAYYSNQIYDFGKTLKPNDFLDDYPCDIVYFRVGWNWLEPEEGKFNWDFTDRIAREWQAKGKRAAYSWVVCYPGDQSTPLWVKDAGAKGVEFNVIEEGKKYNFDMDLNSFPMDAREWMTNSGIRASNDFNGGLMVAESDVAGYRKTWVPNYDDPIFLEKFENFLKAAAQRYNGNEGVDFVEIGSLGSWGEGHIHMSWPAVITSKMKEIHTRLWAKYFNKTTVLNGDDLMQNTSSLALSQELGMGVVDDSVQVTGISGRPEGEMVNRDVTDLFWQNAPVGLENHPYSMPKKTYYDSINLGHATWARLHSSPYLAKESEWTDKITLRLGYRLIFEEVKYAGFKAGNEITFDFKIKNGGAAPCYKGGFPQISILNQAGDVVARGVSALNVKDLKVAETADQAKVECGSLKLTLPKKLPSGEYRIMISVANSEGEPYYNLPLKNGMEKMYRIQTVVV